MRRRHGWLWCIVGGGLLVGLSDFLLAYLLFSFARNRPALGVLQGPATGIFGSAAMRGGAYTAAIGTAIHFLIAFVWVAVYAALFNAAKRMRRRSDTAFGMIQLSVACGVVVWLTMDWLVLRFSRAHYYALSEPYFWILLIGHIPFVGLPIVWSVKRCAQS